MIPKGAATDLVKYRISLEHEIVLLISRDAGVTMFWRSMSCVRRFHASSDPAEASDWSEAAMKASDWLMSPYTCDTAITEEDQNNNKSLT